MADVVCHEVVDDPGDDGFRVGVKAVELGLERWLIDGLR
jgi:hypothetical protein